MSYKTKKTFKTIISAVLAVAVVGGVVALCTSLFKKDEDGLKTIHPTFSVGGLTNTGKYEDTEYSIYTKESFGCQGLKVEVDFDSNIEYQVYFYDTDDNFVSVSESFVEGHTFEVPDTALYARLEVTPIWESNVEEKDKELGYFDTFKYGNQLTVKVNEKQLSLLELRDSKLPTAVANVIRGIENTAVNMGNGVITGGEFLAASSPWNIYMSNVGLGSKMVVKVLSSELEAEDVSLSGTSYPGCMFSSGGGALEYNFIAKDGEYSYIIADTSSRSVVGFFTTADYAGEIEIYVIP